MTIADATNREGWEVTLSDGTALRVGQVPLRHYGRALEGFAGYLEILQQFRPQEPITDAIVESELHSAIAAAWTLGDRLLDLGEPPPDADEETRAAIAREREEREALAARARQGVLEFLAFFCRPAPTAEQLDALGIDDLGALWRAIYAANRLPFGHRLAEAGAMLAAMRRLLMPNPTSSLPSSEQASAGMNSLT